MRQEVPGLSAPPSCICERLHKETRLNWMACGGVFGPKQAGTGRGDDRRNGFIAIVQDTGQRQARGGCCGGALVPPTYNGSDARMDRRMQERKKWSQCCRRLPRFTEIQRITTRV
ncbi:Hypothetical protein SMAX5B_004915 [Scophthalmus maximus]|uniref:Uncharacterized protein n=1 Tax=Scophthalmus maximus TaxID=52904 RepID=A0A2U9BS08_SCOMX|nr:Hypothetical protein SMAX5B_004915 [Scophthalmus maximus]